jgi:hypothetical protein
MVKHECPTKNKINVSGAAKIHSVKQVGPRGVQQFAHHHYGWIRFGESQWFDSARGDLQ